MNSYPPLIADTIPAFYDTIIIPFEHNRYTSEDNRNNILVKILDLSGNKICDFQIDSVESPITISASAVNEKNSNFSYGTYSYIHTVFVYFNIWRAVH